MAEDKQRVETQLLQAIAADGAVADSYEYAQARGVPHDVVVGVLKSLLTEFFVADEEISTSFYVLKDEAKGFLVNGSPEVQVFNAIPVDGVDRKALEAEVGAAVLKVGQGACMKNKWVRMDKASGKLFRNVSGRWVGLQDVDKRGSVITWVDWQVESVTDDATELLRRIEEADGSLAAVSADEANALKRRKLVEIRTRKSYKITKGPNFSVQRKKQAAGLTKEMLDRWAAHVE